MMDRLLTDIKEVKSGKSHTVQSYEVSSCQKDTFHTFINKHFQLFLFIMEMGSLVHSSILTEPDQREGPQLVLMHCDKH